MAEETLEKKAAILSAALEIFNHFGYEKTSMNDIAAKAGVGKGSIYYYFESKEDIYIELMNAQLKDAMHHLEQLIENETEIIGKIRLLMGHVVEILNQKAPLFLQALNNSSIFLKRIKDFIKNGIEEYKCTLRNLMIAGKEQGLFRDDIDINNSIDALTRWFMLIDENIVIDLNPETIQRIIEDDKHLVELILWGIVKR
ncbi:MAG: TetR/AcrR family transcriptional regulator [Candidatus Cloacimonetes bacterium]|nr:TetR/AcrR family transcriptional regulator [Candidatus Cloacimonadota bacterium]